MTVNVTLQFEEATVVAVFKALFSGLNAPPDPRLDQVLDQLDKLKKGLAIMGTTISEQIDAATVDLNAKLATIATDITAISAEIADLQAQVIAAAPAPGSVVTQAQADAFTAAAANLGDLTARLDALATITTPPAAP